MKPLPEKQKRYTAEFFIAIGYITFFCLAFTFCYAYYLLIFLQPYSSPINTFATSLPPTTPTPHIPLNDQLAPKIIIIDNFNNDQYKWEDYSANSKTEIKNGKLTLASMKSDKFAITECMLCYLADESYFIQADFSTDVATDQNFGIVFNHSDSQGNFFLFVINTEAKSYNLYHHISNRWSLRSSGESSLIKSFPEVNTLAVYIVHNDVEIYINGIIVDSYRETGHPFQRGDFGFYSDGGDCNLIVDNLLVGRKGE